MTKPVRLQLSRRKGFDLQALSRATNGLPAIKVDRSTRWGNPWTLVTAGSPDMILVRFVCETVPLLDLTPLRGKNLACWCKPGDPCHADALLEMANREARG